MRGGREEHKKGKGGKRTRENRKRRNGKSPNERNDIIPQSRNGGDTIASGPRHIRTGREAARESRHFHSTPSSDKVILNIIPTMLSWILGGTILLLLGLRLYLFCIMGICKSKNRMDGKTIMITGCTSGIGLETARDLAKRGARIIMACRNMDIANQLKDEFVKESKNENIVVRKLDLSSLQSIRKFAQQINQEESRLDVLIHNAGFATIFEKEITEDGLDKTMAVNHFGPFLLTHLLIDLLKRSQPSRIVVVASEIYRIASFNLNNINPTSPSKTYLYRESKYSNIVFTLELARRLEGSGVTANCLHPGLIYSGIWRNVPFPLSWILKLMTTFSKTYEQGAQTTIHVAVSDELNGVSGKYFMDCAEYGLSKAVKDPAKGKKFWELSEPLVKLQPSDPKI